VKFYKNSKLNAKIVCETYHIESGISVGRMVVHGSHVTGLLVPLAVIVVGHHGDEVQVFVRRDYVVAGVNHFLGGGDCRGEQQA